jgi:hypothetical protein
LYAGLVLPLTFFMLIFLRIVLLTLYEPAFSFSNSLDLVPSPKCEAHDCFLTLFCLAVLQRPGAGLFLTLFMLLGLGFLRLNCSFCSGTLFRLLLMASSAIFAFCAMGPRDFLACCVCLGGFLPLLVVLLS